MIIDMIQGFKPLYEKKGDNLIIENYPLKTGLYITVNDNGIKNHLFINEDNLIDPTYCAKNTDLINYFKIRDYLSILNLYDTNKCVSGKAKSVHSNNFLSLFIREKKATPILLKETSLRPDLKEQIQMYFNQFLIWNQEEKELKKDKNIKNPKKHILTETDDFNEDLFEKSKEAILNTLLELPSLMEQYTFKDNDYVRIFYETSIANYTKEYKRYMIRKAFNKNDYHILKNDKVYGISGIELNSNNNKPSLLLKNMKTEVPLKLDFETLLIAQKLHEFLMFYKVPRYNKNKEKIEYVSSISKQLYLPIDFKIEGLA